MNDELRNNHNTKDSGSNNAVYTSVTNYTSPWHFYNTIPVSYQLDSAVGNGVYVRVTPYIGLAYYDKNDDGVYNTPNGAFNIAGGAYPNLYANGHEYGSYVQGNPIVLANTPQFSTHELFIQSPKDHCPLINIPIGYNYNLYSIGFDIVNNNIIQPAAHIGATLTPPPPAGTLAEERLLRQYGKVFYYKVEYGPDVLFTTTDTFYVFALEADPVNAPGKWNPVTDAANNQLLDTPFGGPLYYNISSGSSGSPTNEIIVDKSEVYNSNYPNFVEYNFPFTPNFSTVSRTISVTSSTTGIGMHFY